MVPEERRSGQPERSQRQRTGHTRNWRRLLHTLFTLASVVLNIILIVLAKRICGQPGCPDYPAHRDPSCPYDWIGYQGKCYYFSKDEGNWSSSQSFCVSQNASLARVESEEMDSVMRFKGKDAFWIGLSRDPGQPWKWTDGENAMMEVVGDGVDCDCSHLSDEAKPSCSRCSTEHRWICLKSQKSDLQQSVSCPRP